MRALPADLAALTVMFRLDTLRILLKRFDPLQPRAPAGTSEGGRWINLGKPPTNLFHQTAERTDDPEVIDLEYEERKGGHTIRQHVGKTDVELRYRINSLRRKDLFTRSGLKRAGTFETVIDANDIINKAISINMDKIESFIKSGKETIFISQRRGYKTGRESVADQHDGWATPVRPTYGVGLVLVRDPQSRRGYRILTAYPRNDDQ